MPKRAKPPVDAPAASQLNGRLLIQYRVSRAWVVDEVLAEPGTALNLFAVAVSRSEGALIGLFGYSSLIPAPPLR